jgi:hypothetical protein
MMQRLSVRTLVLMVELLVAVMAFQYTAGRPVKADAVWLAGDCIAVTQSAAGQADATTVP